MFYKEQTEKIEQTPLTISKSDQSTESVPLLTRIRQAAKGNNTVTFVGSAAGNNDHEDVVLSWGELHQDAKAMAAIMQSKGLKAGEHVALLGPTTRNLVTAIQAVWLCGASVSMLPIPMRLSSIEEFANQTRALMRHGDINMLLLDPTLAVYQERKEEDPPIVLLSELEPGPGKLSANDYQEVPDDPERLAVLQFTSGSTADPKGVMLPYRVLSANVNGMIDAAEVVEDDIFVSWLPLYHDMGLIGFLTVPMAAGCSLVITAPQDFLGRPADWMRWLSAYQGTVTAGPNFSWVLAARALRRMSDTDEILDLSAVRLALNGAEPVDPDVVKTLIETGKEHKFDGNAVFCAFGMAELSLGGTFPKPMRGVAIDAVDRKALEKEGIARPADPKDENTRLFPLLGTPIPGLEMRICDIDTRKTLGLREVGELEIRGTSLMVGYYKRPDLNETLFKEGWLCTGDLAYFVEGPNDGSAELVICGRKKDVIIIAGRNIFPEDIEKSIGTVEGVRAGNVIAFGVEGSKRKEAIVVVAEVRSDDLTAVRQAIRQQVSGIVGYPPRDTMLVQPGTLPKTSSGKLQRTLCRKQYMDNELKTMDQ